MDDGLTLETHLVSHWKQSGELPEQLDVPALPFELEYIWDWWLALNESRNVGMDINHISYTEIMTWSTLLKITLTPFEVRCIMALDSVYINVRREQHARKASQSGNK